MLLIVEIFLFVVLHNLIIDWNCSLLASVDVVDHSICMVEVWVILERVLLIHFINVLVGIVSFKLQVMSIFAVVQISSSYLFGYGWGDWELNDLG